MTKEEKEQTGKYVLQMAKLLKDGCYQQEMLLKAVRIIDEALEQEPKISKEKAIEILKADNIAGYSVEDILNTRDMAIKALEQEPRWIPVDEKLPNDRSWYLGIFKEPDTGWINPLPFICDYVGRETKATTKEHWILHGFTDMDEHIDYYFNLECVKWMPLPPAYEIGEDE